jgi:hypothetical protein
MDFTAESLIDFVRAPILRTLYLPKTESSLASRKSNQKFSTSGDSYTERFQCLRTSPSGTST